MLFPFAKHDLRTLRLHARLLDPRALSSAEEVYEVIEGELEISIDGVTRIAPPGVDAIVPSYTPHSVKALSNGRAIIVDHPVRAEFGS